LSSSNRIGDELSDSDVARTSLSASMKAVIAFRRGNLPFVDCDCTGVNCAVILINSGACFVAAEALFCSYFMICERVSRISDVYDDRCAGASG
jgi:hypothetical protein